MHIYRVKDLDSVGAGDNCSHDHDCSGGNREPLGHPGMEEDGLNTDTLCVQVVLQHRARVLLRIQYEVYQAATNKRDPQHEWKLRETVFIVASL